MGLTSFIHHAYCGVENAWHSLFNFLDAKGIPAGRFLVDPLENRGIPSLPLYFVLALAAYFLLFSGPSPLLTVLVMEKNRPLAGAIVLITYDGLTAAYDLTDETGTASFRVPAGKRISVEVDEGKLFASNTTTITKDSQITVQVGA